VQKKKKRKRKERVKQHILGGIAEVAEHSALCG
jgi:hypothetical protein